MKNEIYDSMLSRYDLTMRLISANISNQLLMHLLW